MTKGCTTWYPASLLKYFGPKSLATKYGVVSSAPRVLFPVLQVEFVGATPLTASCLGLYVSSAKTSKPWRAEMTSAGGEEESAGAEELYGEVEVVKFSVARA